MTAPTIPSEPFLAEFGTDATHIRSDGQETEIRVVFRAPFVQSFVGTTSVQNRDTMCWIPADTVPGINNKSTLRIGTTTYNVREVQNELAGWVRAYLSKD